MFLTNQNAEIVACILLVFLNCVEQLGLTVVIGEQDKPRCWGPLEFHVGSLWIPSQKWSPFIEMHNGRVNNVSYCDNLGKNAFLHTN